MTTMTLTIDDKRQDLIGAFQVFASKFQGVSLEIETRETEEEVLSSFTTAMKDIASGNGIKNAISSKDFLKEIANG